MDKIKLVLSEDKYPRLLERYSLEQIKKIAANMAVKQYKQRPITEAMLYSCLGNLESDLASMFPQGE